MRLLFDARYIRTDFHDGISRYSAELASAVAAVAPSRGVQVVFVICDERQRDSLPEGARCVRMHRPTALREPLTALLLNRYRPDVVFSPMQTIGSAGRRFRLILTLHDTIYYRHRTPPRNLPWYVRLGWRLFHLSYVPQRLTLNAADAVATVSETSAAEFARVRLTSRPVVVVPNAPQQLSAFGVAVVGGAQNLVYMGSFMPYKNVETLVRAMSSLPGRTLHLLSRISPARRASLEGLIVAEGGARGGSGGRMELPGGGAVVFHDGVTDAEYAALLADRAVLVTTSLDEGYGLPVAEALALGVPAVVTDLAIFREVAGSGALYVDPHDPVAVAVAAAVESLDDDSRRAEVVAAGTAHIARFTWEGSAGILLDAVAALAR
ncbi:MAG: glycosyltransferase [Pseudorhodoferax sp.]